MYERVGGVLERPKLEQIIEDMRKVIDDLQLSITYLVFDLEATKRENERLRRILREQR